MDMKKSQREHTQHTIHLDTSNEELVDSSAVHSLQKQQAPKPQSYMKVTIICFLISFSGFIVGWDVGVIGGILNMSDFQHRFAQYNPMTQAYEFDNIRTGLISGFYGLAAMVGCYTIPLLVDRIGKRKNLIFANIVYIVGGLVYITATDKWYQIFVGRLIIGYAIGGLSVLSPSLIAEIAPVEIRGTLNSFYQILSCFGLVVGNIICYGCNFIQGSSMQWRIPLIMGFVWQVLMLSGLLLAPESQSYLIQRGNFVAAFKSLETVYPNKTADEINEILEDLKSKLQSSSDDKVDIHYLIHGRPKIFYRMVCGCLMQAFQGLTGINFFFYYSTTVFKGVGLSSSFVASIILGTVYASTSFLSFPITKAFKRKTIILVGSVATVILLLTFTLLTTLALYPNGAENASSVIVGKLVIMVTCFYIFTFSVTWGPMAYVVMNEIFPLKANKIGVTFSMSTNWLMAFLVSFCTPFITDRIGFNYGYIFTVCSFMSIFFVYFCVPETKDLTFDEIDDIFAHNKLFHKVKKPVAPDSISLPEFKLNQFENRDYEFDQDATPVNNFVTTEQDMRNDYFSNRL